jgi:hypothetical protein
MTNEPPDNLDAYMDLGAQEIARLLLCMMIEEVLRERLAAYRVLCQPLELGSAGAPISSASANASDTDGTSLASSFSLNR